MRPWLSALALVTLVVGCRDSQPTPPELPGAASSLIPDVPAPQPTATPTPEPTPDDPLPATPGTGGDGPSGSCGAPTPPAVSRINVKIYNASNDRVTLDSTPQVGPDWEYCRAIGYTDGRSFCPVRPDGHPERLACEAARIGRAADTGRVGPTWAANGQPCAGVRPGASCVNHGSNQFFVFAYGSGTFRACANSGVCGSLTLK